MKMTAIILSLVVTFGIFTQANAQSNRTPDSFSYDVSFTNNEIIMLEHSYEFSSVVTRKKTVDIRKYYRTIEDTIKDHGGEIAVVLDIYNLTEGIRHPSYSAMIKWPTIQAYRTFINSSLYAELSTEIHFERFFFKPSSDTMVSFDSDLNYEIFTGTIKPAAVSNLAKFFNLVPAVIGDDYSRDEKFQFIPLGLPDSTFTADLGGLVVWPTLNHLLIFGDTKLFQKHVHLRNSAIDRIDLYNGRVIPIHRAH